jgi:hypothetical protein
LVHPGYLQKTILCLCRQACFPGSSQNKRCGLSVFVGRYGDEWLSNSCRYFFLNEPSERLLLAICATAFLSSLGNVVTSVTHAVCADERRLQCTLSVHLFVTLVSVSERFAMWHFLLRRARSAPAQSRAPLFLSLGVTLLLGLLLAACGESVTTQLPPQPTAVTTARPTPTPPLQPTPTPVPTPTLAPVPTQTLPQGPVILDLQPASMSFVGHLDCPISNGDYVCHARVLARASNPGNLTWTSFVNFANNVLFSPGSGTLAPGHSVDVFIHIPTNDCAHGLFFFQGPTNTHTITWAC